MEDMDWTEPFLERGTTFSLDGPMICEGIPVSCAYVKNEVLYVEGTADFETGPATTHGDTT
jgi:hypothetical protein